MQKNGGHGEQTEKLILQGDCRKTEIGTDALNHPKVIFESRKHTYFRRARRARRVAVAKLPFPGGTFAAILSDSA